MLLYKSSKIEYFNHLKCIYNLILVVGMVYLRLAQDVLFSNFYVALNQFENLIARIRDCSKNLAVPNFQIH